MPAVTVDDILTLPRLLEPDPDLVPRPVQSVTTGPTGFEGEGFPVRRAFGGVDTTDIDGTMMHQDSHGGGGVITNGDTQWMTAGSGILHIETPPEELVVTGGLFHGFQLWVNLPAKDKFLPPRYQDLNSSDVTLLSTPDGGTLIRLVAGELDGHKGPGSTHTPMAMLHATLSPGARMRLPWRHDFNALVYVLNGNGSFGEERAAARMGNLAVFGPGDTITVSADVEQESRSPDMDVLVLGGRPIREPVAWAGPFVMNTRQELVQAFDDYQAGKLGQIPHGAIGNQ